MFWDHMGYTFRRTLCGFKVCALKCFSAKDLTLSRM